MNIKYYLMTVLAAASMLFVSCGPEEVAVKRLEGIKLGSTYVTIAKGETTAKTTMTINEAWTAESPEWLTVDPAKGDAGDFELTFTALAETLNKGAVLINFGSKTQQITIIRDGDKPKQDGVVFEEPFIGHGQGDFETKDINGSPWSYDSKYGMKATAYIGGANTDAESYLVSPEIDLTEETVALLTFEQAVNYMNGETMADYLSVEVTEDNGNNWAAVEVPTWPVGSGWDFVPSGDVDLSAYLGKKIKFAFHYKSTTKASPTWEIKNVKIANIAGAVPPQLSLDNTTVNLGAEEDLTATITATTDGSLAVTGPFSDEACAVEIESPWLSFTESSGVVTVTATANDGDARTAYIKFVSSNEYGETPVVATVVQAANAGAKGATVTNPYSVAEVIAAIDATSGKKIDTPVYVKGIISSVESFNSKYGSMTYWISEDGTTESVQFECYSGLYFGSEKFTALEDLSTGYEVVVCGTVKLYQKEGQPDVYEFNYNNYICSLNGATASFTVAQAKAALDAGDVASDQTVLVTGIINTIDEISWDVTAEKYYGNAQYWISDDGASADFEIFRGYYLGNEKFTAENQIAVGDHVTVIGTIKIYKKDGQPDIYEFNSGNYILSLKRPE